ncbi:MAG: MBL fold metallo-hydrolase [Acidaminococcales bacterium]|jgi:glyoxylase-like metal-dependent hydrolase (beta-lactamase superfamily II)|nr:MBL fold metallo-hydrolase [Acidaminococcales bacterium]
MKIILLEVGSLGTDCYIAVNEKEKRGVIIDPGADARHILKTVKDEGLKIEAILLTHGHSDHIGALKEVAETLKAPVMIGEKDADMLTNARFNLSSFMGENITCGKANRFLKDGETIEAAGLTFEVAATPGHTPGGCCFKCGDVVFCGDTIFCESIGRTDFPGGSYSQLLQSIKSKILTLPDGVKLLPGHGPATEVGWERRMNPFLQ